MGVYMIADLSILITVAVMKLLVSTMVTMASEKDTKQKKSEALSEYRIRPVQFHGCSLKWISLFVYIFSPVNLINL
jgi:hypothetical protein